MASAVDFAPQPNPDDMWKQQADAELRDQQSNPDRSYRLAGWLVLLMPTLAIALGALGCKFFLAV